MLRFAYTFILFMFQNLERLTTAIHIWSVVVHHKILGFPDIDL